MSSAETAASKQAMKHLTSVRASHQNQVPLDTTPVCQAWARSSWEEKYSIWETFMFYILKYVKTEPDEMIFYHLPT